MVLHKDKVEIGNSGLLLSSYSGGVARIPHRPESAFAHPLFQQHHMFWYNNTAVRSKET
jgi:hypothetical protein